MGIGYLVFIINLLIIANVFDEVGLSGQSN